MARAVRLEPRTACLVLATLLAAGAGCADRTPTESSSAAADLADARPRFIVGSGATAGISVLVLQPGGTEPAAGAIVTAVGPNGPFNGAGEYAVAVTDAQGSAFLDGLLVGASYCVHARPITPQATAVPLVPPPSGSAEGSADPNGWAPVVTGANGTVPLTKQNFLDNCVNDRPVEILYYGAAATLEFVEATLLNLSLLDLEGAPVPDAAWAILPFERHEIPWPWWQGIASELNDVPPDIKPGLLQSVAAAPQLGITGGHGLRLAVQPGEPYFIEVLTGDRQTPHGRQGRLTITLIGSAGSEPGGEELGEVQLEPLLCAVGRTPEQEGDAGSSLDFLDLVKHGYQASAALEPDPSSVAVWFDHAGTGNVTVHFRIDRPGAVWNLMVDYAWTGTDWQVTRVNRTPRTATLEAEVFFADRGAGRYRATLLLGGVPADARDVQFSVRTPGDQIPDAPRRNTANAFISIERPTECTAGQSNDDRWGVQL